MNKAVKKRLNKALVIICLVVGYQVDGAKAWHTHPALGITHWIIANDAVNFVFSSEYPDLHKFAAELRNGSNTEAHAPPSVPGSSATSPHRWSPVAEDWWDYATNPVI